MQLSCNMAPGARLCRNCWASCLRHSRSFFSATTISSFVGGTFSSTFSVALSPVTSCRAGLHGECRFSVRRDAAVMVHSTKKYETTSATVTTTLTIHVSILVSYQSGRVHSKTHWFWPCCSTSEICATGRLT